MTKQPFRNAMLEDLRDGKPCLGLGLHHLRTNTAALIARAMDHNWLFIDGEHGSFGQDDLAQLSLSALMTGVTPLVRVHGGALDSGVRALDNGAQGIVIPHVSSAEQARRIVDALRYPPLGKRSWGGPPVLFGYQAGPMGEAQIVSNGATICMCMIESQAGLDAADEIAAVEGVDALMLGASDLSVDLGTPGQIGHEKIAAAVDRVVAACRAAGKFPGIGLVQDTAIAADYLARGMTFIIAGTDHSYLMSAAAARSGALRASFKA